MDKAIIIPQKQATEYLLAYRLAERWFEAAVEEYYLEQQREERSSGIMVGNRRLIGGGDKHEPLVTATRKACSAGND